MYQQEPQTKKLLEIAAWCRSQVIDDCELELGDSPRWVFFRSRLLKVFGDRGLQGKIIEVMETKQPNEVDHE